MIKTIPKQVLSGLKSIADETLEQGGDELKKVIGISTDKPVDLMPDINKINPEQRAQLENKDKQESQSQVDQIRQAMGRDLEGEVEQIRKQKESEEEEKERQFLENLKRQRRAEEEERARMAVSDQTPAHRKKKSRGSAFAKGKPKSSDLSATGEFSRKKD